eukprot:Anaeramoba_ignava/c21365_g2_i1.p1 GENE.c21365_g2_i1~~c21365_g2_i1.p1  ORF type:complete len:2050 (+),score=579.25 c21365_g2_i1:957-7106(+)
MKKLFKNGINNSSYQNIQKSKNQLRKTFFNSSKKIVQKKKHSIAIRTLNKKMTYESLDMKSTSFAKYMKEELNVKPGSLIAISILCSIPSTIAILAILKLGCVYVPLDPRLSKILTSKLVKQFGINLLFTGQKTNDIFSGIENDIENHSLKIMCLTEEIIDNIHKKQDHKTQGIPKATKTTKGSDNACILVTFSDEGTPLGIQIAHSNIINKSLACKEHFKMTDAVAHYSPLSSERGIIELWGTLLNGGKLAITSKKFVLSNKFPVVAKILDMKFIVITTFSFRRILNEELYNLPQIETFLNETENEDEIEKKSEKQISNDPKKSKEKNQVKKPKKNDFDEDDSDSSVDFEFHEEDFNEGNKSDLSSDGESKFFELKSNENQNLGKNVENSQQEILELNQQVAWPFEGFEQVIVYGDPIEYDLLDAFLQLEKKPNELIYCSGIPENSSIVSLIKLYDSKIKSNELLHAIDRSTTNAAPIGKSFADSEIFILDDHYRPVPSGAKGTIFVCGEAMCNGYYQNQEITDSLFVSSPSGGLMFRTGETGCLLPSGELEHLGYREKEINSLYIQDERVNVWAVETILQNHPKISEIITIIRDPQKQFLRRIIACIAPNTEVPPSSTEMSVFMKEYLPSTWIPDSFSILENFPVNQNGKMDRNKIRTTHEIEKNFNNEPDRKYMKPTNDVEEFLCQTYATVLKYERVSINDNFFILGGNSIDAMRIVSKAMRAGVKFSYQALFQYPVVSDLAAFVLKNRSNIFDFSVVSFQGLKRIESPDFYQENECPLSPIQAWFLEQNFFQPNQYNIISVIKLKTDVDIPTLEKSLNFIYDQNECFKMCFSENKLKHKLKVNPEIKLSFAYVEVTPNTPTMPQMCSQLQKSFDIANGPLARFVAFKDLDDQRYLVISSHHLVIDLESMKLFIQKLDDAYQKNIRDPKLDSQEKLMSHFSWIAEQYSEEPTKEAYLFWQKIAKKVSDQNVVKYLPREGQQWTANLQEYKSSLVLAVNSKITNDLFKRICRNQPKELISIVLTAISLALNKWTGSVHQFFHLFLSQRKTSSTIFNNNYSKILGWQELLVPLLLSFTAPGVTADKKKALSVVKQQVYESLRFLNQLNSLLYTGFVENLIVEKEKARSIALANQANEAQSTQTKHSKFQSLTKSKSKQEDKDGLNSIFTLPNSSTSAPQTPPQNPSQSTPLAAQPTPPKKDVSDVDQLLNNIPNDFKNILEPLKKSELSFAFLGDIDMSNLSLGEVSHWPVIDNSVFGDLYPAQQGRPHLIEVVTYIHKGALHFKFQFNHKAHNSQDIRSLATNALKILSKMYKEFLKQDELTDPINFPLSFSSKTSVFQSLFSEDEKIQDIILPIRGQHEIIQFFHRKKQIVKQHICKQLVLSFHARKFDVDLFKNSLEMMISRHPIMRSYFTKNSSSLDDDYDDDDENFSILQIVRKSVELSWKEISWEKYDAAQRFNLKATLLKEDRQKTFRFASPPLYRFILVNVDGRGEYLLVFSFEPFMFDSWSLPIIINEVFALYTNMVASGKASIATPDEGVVSKDYIQSIYTPDSKSHSNEQANSKKDSDSKNEIETDFFFSEQDDPIFKKNSPSFPSNLIKNPTEIYLKYLEWENSTKIVEAKRFFKHIFGDVDFSIPITKKRSTPFGETGQTVEDNTQIETESREITGQFHLNAVSFHELSMRVEASKFQKLKQVAESNQIILSTIFHFSWAIALALRSKSPTLCFGTYISGRPPILGPGIEQTIGYYSRALPFRVALIKEQSILKHLEQIQLGIVKTSYFANTTISQIRKWCGLQETQDLFDGGVVLVENYPKDSIVPVRDLGENNYVFSINTEKAGLNFENVSIHDSLRYPLLLVVHCDDSSNEILVRLIFDKHRFDIDTPPYLLKIFINTLNSIPENIGSNILQFIKDLLQGDTSKQAHQDKKLRSESIFDPQKVLKSGFLKEYGGSGLKGGWRKRWFVLKNDDCLYYFKSQKSANLCGVIPLKDGGVEILSNFKKKYCFKITVEYREYFISSDSNGLTDEWFNAIVSTQQKQKGKDKSKNSRK